MSKRTLEPPVIGIAAVYFILFTLVLWPIIDFLVTALPLQLGRMEWRYASLGLMAMYIGTPIMGVALAMVMAFILRQRRILLSLSGLCLLGATFLLLAMLALSLDMVQLWGIPTAEAFPSPRLGALVTGAKQLAGFAATLLLGISGWQASRRMAREKEGMEVGTQTHWLGAKANKPRTKESPS